MKTRRDRSGDLAAELKTIDQDIARTRRQLVAELEKASGILHEIVDGLDQSKARAAGLFQSPTPSARQKIMASLRTVDNLAAKVNDARSSAMDLLDLLEDRDTLV